MIWSDNMTTNSSDQVYFWWKCEEQFDGYFATSCELTIVTTIVSFKVRMEDLNWGEKRQ